MKNKQILPVLNIKNPNEIEAESFRLIEEEVPEEIRAKFTRDEWIIARRIIHTTGDISIVNSVIYSDNAIPTGINALKNGCNLFSDSNMIKNGVSVAKLQSMNNSYSRESIRCFIADESVAKYAKKHGITRAIASVEKASNYLNDSIIMIGNAPSALIKVIEKCYNEEIKPKLIIGMPVGFVNVVESKKLLMQTNIPFISIEGRRGGSPLAVATLHALIEIYNLK